MTVSGVGGTQEFKARPDVGATPQAVFTPSSTLPSFQSGVRAPAEARHSEWKELRTEVHDHAASASAMLRAVEGKSPHLEAEAIAEGLSDKDLEDVVVGAAVEVASHLGVSIEKALELIAESHSG